MRQYRNRTVIYSSLFTSNGSKKRKINRQTDRQKQTVSLNKEETNYIAVYKIPKTAKSKWNELKKYSTGK